ncbi:MAG: branched-chain amino acid aminotransferase [Hyphomonadaceae bacterium]|nr:branched-chain amino acid aminotransferase [Hyphomonadaceae bacterium]MBX3511397.1 branched-chain amino acid aminotransferase [Hyphomonadaceae bacterium]
MALVPFDDRDGWIWLDGAFVPWRDAKIHILSHAVHYGSAVFEGERMYNGRIFALEEHTERLINSAALLDFTIPFDGDAINAASIATCVKNGFTDCYVRPIAWRGAEQLSVSARETKIHLAIAVWDWPKYFDEEKFARGIRLCWAKYRRPPANSAPTAAKAVGLYMICTVSKNAAERDGYEDALMLDTEGNIAETTGANIFFIRDGVLHTPIADRFLDGITRRTIIAMARARGLEVIDRRISPLELDTFSECFVVGTAAEVTPVGEIAEHRFTPGPITFGLADGYAALVRGEPPAKAHQTIRTVTVSA